MKNFIIRLLRFWSGLKRPSKKANAKRLQSRGETITSFTIREAVADDIPALVDLHVTTWNATYPGFRHPPTHATREYQWRKAFDEKKEKWFCFVVENRNAELIGFAQANQYCEGLPGFSGQLNKIYLLHDYQRLGLGRRLLGHVVRRFISQNINSMLLFSEPANPSCAFYEALGGERLHDSAGRFHGAYGWRDLKKLESILPH